MAEHECHLYDEFHRIIILGDELSADPKKIKVRLVPTASGKHSLEITPDGKPAYTILLGSIKVPPDTGVAMFVTNLVKNSKR